MDKKLFLVFFVILLYPLAVFAQDEAPSSEGGEPAPEPVPEEPVQNEPQPEPAPETSPEPEEESTSEGGEPAPEPVQDEPRDEDTGFESCPPTPPNNCAEDQAVKAIFDDRGCVVDHECGPPGSGAVHFESVPEGCHIEENEFGNKFVKCEDDNFAREKENAERRCREHGGKFFVSEDGAFECSFEGRGGFFEGSQCPSPESLREQENRCSEEGGEVEYFRDRYGCEVVSCRQAGFQFEGEEGRIKAMAYQCESTGGQFIIRETGGTSCIGGEERIKINRELRPLDGVDLLKIALKIEDTIKALNEISDKLNSLGSYYDNRGDEQKAESFSIAVSQLDGAITRLDEIRIGLAENADNLNGQDRVEVLQDLQRVKGIIKDVAVTILTGGESRRAKAREFREEFEFETDFEGRMGPEEGFDIFRAFQNCEAFSKDEPFVFSPEPGINVRLEGLEKGKCVMKVSPEEFPAGMTMLLPTEVYKFFNGPHMLLRDDVECSPEFACQFMKRDIEREAEFERRRFGEMERYERRGFEERYERRDEFREERSFREDFDEFEDGFRGEFEGEFRDFGGPEDFDRFGDEFGEFGPPPEFEDDFRDFRGPRDFREFEDFDEDPFRTKNSGFCGDGAVAPGAGEECDDGNNQGGDGCSPDCRVENPELVANVIKEFGDKLRGGQ